MEAEKENALSSDLQGSCDDNDILGNDNNDNSLAADAHFESLMLHSNSNSISNMQLHHQASPGAHFHQSQPHSHVNFYDHLDISTLSESESMAIVKYSTGMVVDLADSYLPSPVLSVPAASPTVPMDMTLPMTEMPSYYSPYSSDALSALQTQSQSGLYVNTGFPINTLPTIRPLNAYEKEQYQLYALHQQEHYDQSQLGHQQHHQLDHSPSMLASSLDMTYSYGDVQSPTMPMSLPIAISSSRSSHIGPMPRKKSTGSKLRGPLAHKRADMPLKLFKCTFNDHSDDSTCEKIFKRMEHLKRHMRVHTGERRTFSH